MENKQKNAWKNLYDAAGRIAALEPWDHIPEHTPLFVLPGAAEEKKVVFEIIGQDWGSHGILCFPSEIDYLHYETRRTLGDPKKMPAKLMQDSFFVLWLKPDELGEKDLEIIRKLDIEPDANGEVAVFSSVHELTVPSALSDKDADLLAGMLPCLLCICESAAEPGRDIDFAHNNTLTYIRNGDGSFSVETCGYPEHLRIPSVSFPDNEISEHLRRMPASELSIELDERCGDPEPDMDSEAFYYPLNITAVDAVTGEYITHIKYENSFGRINALIDALIDICGEHGRVSEIKVDDPFTYAALAELCTRSGIKLTLQQEPLECVTDLAQQMLNDEDDDDIYDLQELPGMYSSRRYSPTLIEDDGMPKTFIISVSVYKGCYRHIRIPGDCTMEDLHTAILDAFGFDDDHAHAFFMDNRVWSDAGIYSQYLEDKENRSCDYTLSQLLEEKQNFMYLFDFGSEWRFQCKVLHKYNEQCSEAEVIRTVGESPEQYSEYY